MGAGWVPDVLTTMSAGNAIVGVSVEDSSLMYCVGSGVGVKGTTEALSSISIISGVEAPVGGARDNPALAAARMARSSGKKVGSGSMAAVDVGVVSGKIAMPGNSARVAGNVVGGRWTRGASTSSFTKSKAA